MSVRVRHDRWRGQGRAQPLVALVARAAATNVAAVAAEVAAAAAARLADERRSWRRTRSKGKRPQNRSAATGTRRHLRPPSPTFAKWSIVIFGDLGRASTLEKSSARSLHPEVGNRIHARMPASSILQTEPHFETRHPALAMAAGGEPF